MFRSLALAVVLAATNIIHPTKATATAWEIDTNRSVLAYEISIGDATAEGTFDTWIAQIEFDLAAPEAGRVNVEIDTGSVTISDPRASSSVGAPAWLSVATFPSAEFSAKGFNFTSEDAFTLPGMLTLRGVSHPVTLSGTLLIEGDVATVKATTAFDRALFQIGDGQEAVSQGVLVRIDVVATRSN